MKSLLTLGMAMAATSCTGPQRMSDASHASDPPIPPIMIDFQHGFRTNVVELQMNQQKIFSGVLTTDNRIGLAKHVPYFPHNTGSIDALVVVNGSERYAYRIRPDRGRNVGFYKDLDSGRLHMVQKKQPFLYD